MYFLPKEGEGQTSPALFPDEGVGNYSLLLPLFNEKKGGKIWTSIAKPVVVKIMPELPEQKKKKEKKEERKQMV